MRNNDKYNEHRFLHQCFKQECQRVKQALGEEHPGGPGTKMMDMIMASDETELEANREHFIINSAVIAMHVLLDASPFDAVRAYAVWGELMTAAYTTSNEVAYKSRELAL